MLVFCDTTLKSAATSLRATGTSLESSRNLKSLLHSDISGCMINSWRPHVDVHQPFGSQISLATVCRVKPYSRNPKSLFAATAASERDEAKMCESKPLLVDVEKYLKPR
jgi:hypothetical protein